MAPTPKPGELGSQDTVVLKYNEILKSNGITDEVSEVIVGDSGLQGEGQSSQTQYVTVKFKNANVKPLNLFVKSHSDNASHSEFLEDTKLFEKEARFFVEYLPAAKAFCKSKGCENLVDLYPKCYFGDKNMIVFENLVLEKGYELLNKQERQDLDAVRFAVTTLAKHHAISYAFIKESDGPENFFKRFQNLDFEAYAQPTARAMLDSMLDKGIVTNVTMLQKSNLPGTEGAIGFLNSYMGKVYDDLLNNILYNPEDEKLLVLDHGDYWNNNMMFLKDKETNQIIGHKAIDLQVTRYNSPGLDLGYYMLTSIKGDVRRAHLHEILGWYYETLTQTAVQLGHPIDLSYEELYLSFRKKLKFGFWIALCVMSDAGFAAVKNLNMNEVGDLKNWSVMYDKLIQEWINANPEQAAESAKSILDFVNEYRELLVE
ncbi:unnamed protein product [Orchesella dallaii]|uniref:CHK kinase-like domain-containing protein n=1 Tax=Orchesella dallaii TaxID=48710 RepID=A0ABP1RA54_9HEXA